MQPSAAGRAPKSGSRSWGATACLTLMADSTVQSVTDTDGLGFFAFRDLAAGDYHPTIARIGYGLHEQ